MPDIEQIPHLLKLLDDESQTIRQSVLKEFASYGTSLENTLASSYKLDTTQQELLKPVFENNRQVWLKNTWPRWFRLKNDYEKIEEACSIIAEYQYGLCYTVKLSSLLDQYAAEFAAKYTNPDRDALELAHFLFKEKKLTGAKSEYYDPRNSNLVYVILEKKGIPISLTLVYMLIGNRVGIKIEGCKFPHHFLARTWIDDKVTLIDCFRGGGIIGEHAIYKRTKRSREEIKDAIHRKITAEQIIERLIRNLVRAYQQANEISKGFIMIELLRAMACDPNKKKRTSNSKLSGKQKKSTKVLFKSGQLVKHKQYGYRGVVVDFDKDCRADDLWYESNNTQPRRDQPWYHVLVDGTDQVTYPAESSLEVDPQKTSIDHPLLDYFFNGFEDGAYIRNDNPWTE